MQPKPSSRAVSRRLRALCGALILATGAVARGEPVNVYIGHGQMPFADSGPDQVGLFGEVMGELCARLTLECRIRDVPWKRVQHDVAEDPRGIVLNLGRTPEREGNFIWLVDVVPTSYVLVSVEQSFDSLDQALRAGPVVVMGGTPRAEEVHAHSAGAQRVVEVTDPEMAARMLASRRVVAWYEIDLRSLYLWKRLGLNHQPMHIGKPISSTDSYIAASPKFRGAQALKAQMNEAFEAMKHDGSWRRMLAGYLDERKVEELLQAEL